MCSGLLALLQRLEKLLQPAQVPGTDLLAVADVHTEEEHCAEEDGQHGEAPAPPVRQGRRRRHDDEHGHE